MDTTRHGPPAADESPPLFGTREPDNTAGPGEPPSDPPVEDVLLEALASDMTYAEAGKVAGMSSRTVARRLDDPTFAAAVDARRRELAQESISHIRRLRARRFRAAIDAQHVLVDLLHHEDPKIQLAAARQLHTSSTVKHDVDVHERLLALEGRLEPLGDPRPPLEWTL